jgi:predicted dehydrogenase
MIKVGMIGCGGMATYHAPSLKELDGIEVVAACDIIESKARHLETEYFPGIKVCTDFRDLLNDVDAVWVCTEPFNRVDIVTACAAAGKDIFTEKPLALNLEDADTMLAATRKAGVKYMLGYCLRFWQPFRIMRETFASGELGDLITCWTRRFMPADFRGDWYGKQELSGGVALDFGSHDLDWLLTIGGSVKTVFAHTMRIRDGIEADEHSQCMLTFANGGMGSSDVTWWEAINESSLGIVGTKGSMVVGRDGKLYKQIVGQEEEILDVENAMAIDPEGNVGRRDEDSGKIERVDLANESIHEHFLRCIRDDVEPMNDASIGRDVLELVIALRESAATGRSVDL